MTLGDIATKARALTQSDIVQYPDANLLIDINIWYQKIVSMIFESQDESDFDDARKTNYPIVTTPMIANQRDYPIPVSESVLKIKRVDITWDGTHWYRANPLDSGAYPYGIGFDNATSVDSEFDTNFIKEEPRYDISYNSVWIMPMPTATDVANGAMIRMEWERNVTPFVVGDYSSVITDSTVIPGFDAPFHPMLAEGAALEFARAKLLPQIGDFEKSLTDWEARLRQAYGHKELDRVYALGVIHSDNYGR